jgi:hypothetical protein
VTQEDQDTLIGRRVREEKEQAEKYQFLISNAKAIGEKLEAAGKMLQSNPTTLVFEGQSVPATRYRSETLFMDTDFPSADTVRQMSAEIREAVTRLKSLHDELGRLGYPVPAR